MPASVSSPKDIFLRRLARCTRQQDFLAAFYTRFIASSAEVQRKFQPTNFEQQHGCSSRRGHW